MDLLRRRLRNYISGFFLLGLSFCFLGMAGRGQLGKGALRAEIRLKLYDEAASHYEKAKALDQNGRSEEALEELRKAKRVVSEFPEAYDLARKIYQKLGKTREALEEEKRWRESAGDRGASLYRLRQKVVQEIEFQKKSAPPPDIQPVPALIATGCLAAVLILGMILEYRRIVWKEEEEPKRRSIFLEKFPEEEPEVRPSWFFKLLLLLLPAPFLFSLLVLGGFRYYSDILPLFLLAFIVADIFLYVIFLADLSGLGEFRRPGGFS